MEPIPPRDPDYIPDSDPVALRAWQVTPEGHEIERVCEEIRAALPRVRVEWEHDLYMRETTFLLSLGKGRFGQCRSGRTETWEMMRRCPTFVEAFSETAANQFARFMADYLMGKEANHAHP